MLSVSDLDAVLARLRSDGFRVIGPAAREGAVVYTDVRSTGDLPAGWSDEQDAGKYRLVPDDSPALFAQGPGPESWKRFLYPPRELQWRVARDGEGELHFEAPDGDGERPLALVGVRACDLAAIDVLDRVLIGDPAYARRRGSMFVVAVTCSTPGGTCFCDSLGTGPRPTAGFDLALTEILDGDRHVFVTEVGSARGADVLAGVDAVAATPADVAAAAAVVACSRASMGRVLPTEGLREALLDALDDPAWDDVAARCLACGNCTQVCPTCFCATNEDVTGLDPDLAERHRRWDSCFTLGHSYIHGGSIRPSVRARYRQWLTHKLATWVDQYGSSGCVGCGRCITWCPAGIDLTAEATRIAAAERIR